MVPEMLEHGEAPLLRSSLRERIKDVMLQRIVAGVYKPGSWLVETRIAQELRVSQASVREALRDLEHIGCVWSTSPTAAEHMTAAELRELHALYDAMMAAARAGDAHEQSQADAAAA